MGLAQIMLHLVRKIPGVSAWLWRRELERRIAATIACRDVEAIPKVENAGAIITVHGERAQVMHNGVKVVAGGFHGDWMAHIITQLRGHHEPQEEKVFDAVIQAMPPGACMLEVGCFWAYYSLWFHHAVPRASNYLIEPNPAKLALGRRNFALNGYEGRFFPGFIGESSAPAAVFTDWDGAVSTLPRYAIDDFLDQQSIAFLHLLHSDIQGAEWPMLLGCRRALAEQRIGCYCISTHQDRHQRCLDMLRDYGLHIIAEHRVEQGLSADGLIVARLPSMPGPDKVEVSVAPVG